MPDKTYNFKIAGVVVLYNPEIDTINNIKSYLNQLDLLIAFDNSETQNTIVSGELKKISGIEYIFNMGNAGIAAALNKSACFAVDKGYQYLLTMDQDTIADSNLISNYKGFLLRENLNKIGILAPVTVYHIGDKINATSPVKELEVAITSGTLLNLEIFKQIGPFQENLFIDYVDYEYCLRLRKKGYQIIQLNTARIYHQLGNLEPRNLLFKKVYVTHHSPVRYYYRTRNRFFVYKKYLSHFPSFILRDLIIFINEFLKIIVFEKNKSAKLKMIVRGLIDFIENKYGKFN